MVHVVLHCLRGKVLQANTLARLVSPQLLRTFSSLEGPPDYDPDSAPDISIVRKQGFDVLHDPVFNKGTAFPLSERERLGLRGLLPPRVLDMKAQIARVNDELLYGKNYIDPSAVKDGGLTEEGVRKWRVLQGLQDRNETLFYRILIDNFTDLAPIVYTPTVGWACLNFHKLYRRPRGMFFSAEDRGEMASMVWNWPSQEVDAIVVTDGSRILGLGDLGLNGLGIPIGKLDLYVAAAGFNPARILPVVVDVGTDNQALRGDPLYPGLDRPRIRGSEYFEIMDEFVSAVMGRWPQAVLQFEDFQLEHAEPLLNRYRHRHLVFNDDIQGTAATAVAGIYGALAAQDLPARAITEQRFVVVGAGSAGMGVVRMIAAGMVKNGLSFEEAASRFWVFDTKGLITAAREGVTEVVAPFARRGEGDVEGESVMSVIQRVHPTALIGLAGAGRLFTPDVLRATAHHCPRPLVFPMSNPTSKMECTSEEAAIHTGGRAIFAAGSPQPDVEFEGRVIPASQANNMYIFPGLAMGAYLGHTGVISDEMLMTAAEALPSLISEEDRAAGRIYPRLSSIREISTVIAREVIKTAAEEGHLHNPKALRALARGDEELSRYIRLHMFTPKYTSLVKLPTGVME